MKCVLVATDGSADSGRAVEYAAQMVKDSGARLVVVNVVGDQGLPSEIFRRITRAQQDWLTEQLEAHSAELLKRAQDQLRNLGVPSVQLESRRGDIAQTIIEIAEDMAVEAIVVGKRGTGQVVGVLLGSVSQKLVSLAERVVIVVP